MKLVLTTADSAATPAEPESSGGVVRRHARDLEQVLAWVTAEPVERVVVPWPSLDLNPFALARQLRRSGGPRVVLAGEFGPGTRFWAERNGCRVAESTETALALEEDTP